MLILWISFPFKVQAERNTEEHSIPEFSFRVLFNLELIMLSSRNSTFCFMLVIIRFSADYIEENQLIVYQDI